MTAGALSLVGSTYCMNCGNWEEQEEGGRREKEGASLDQK